ncbi:MAG TPA: molybdopterin-dependent oxidoreductase [Planctomycetaceae bacterium]|nr:molybdopterin-dependent oxidoreductase [Planctomycetaceae bacterium]
MNPFLEEHVELTRRRFVQAGLASAAALSLVSATTSADETPKPVKIEKAGAFPEPYFTPPIHFRDVSRGKPVPHSLPAEKQAAVGLTRDTWQLEVLADPASPAKLGKELKRESGTALDFASLMKLAETKSVRFPKVMTCLNLGCPLGMGLWEGVPLREVIALTQPRENLRRVFYHGYHNDDPKQLFRSSLPIGRVLEDLHLPPVILCYKLNGEWLDAERGGPVRIVVPEAYGFKSIKWLTQVFLTNLPTANDTYAEQNNDVDSPLKTFAASLSVPREVKAGEAIPVSGYAQVGVAGLSKVQVWAVAKDQDQYDHDPYYTTAPWRDAEILPASTTWSGLPDGKIPADTWGFQADGTPKSWPLLLTNAHWAAVIPALPPGDYTFRCRSVDAYGHAQPLPRPFRKSGHAAIESVDFKVIA